MKNTTVCTICSYNYLAFGINCCHSVKNHNNNIDVYLLIVDKQDLSVELIDNSVINYKFVDELDIEPDLLLEMKFKYNVIEMNTAVKPAFILHLMSKGYENIIYLDPDIMCFNSLKYIENKLLHHNMILTPHRITPIHSCIIDDSVFLNNGLYNLGFIAVKNQEKTKELLLWWNEKLKNQAFLDYTNGLATDQLWANFFPLLLEDICISKHFGMNVAFWNIEERNISRQNDIYYANNDELLFFHFSGFSLDNDMILKNGLSISKYLLLSDLFNIYKNAVLSKKHLYYTSIAYGFNCYSNGLPIQSGSRHLYSELKYTNCFNKDPFSISKDSFYYFFVKQNGRTLFSKDKLNSNRIHFRILKLFILLFGINKLFSIMKYFNALSVQNIAKLYKDDK